MGKLLLLILITLFLFVKDTSAQINTAPKYEEATIQKVELQNNQKKVTAKFETGDQKGNVMNFDTRSIPPAIAESLKTGDRVLVSQTKTPDGKTSYLLADYVRKFPLLLLFSVFIALVFVVTRWQGLLSFVGMILSFLVIIKFIIPQILAGANPFGVALIGSLCILPFTFYLAHGISKKTTIALAGTFIALVTTAFLAYSFTVMSRLTGFAAEETTFLQQMGGATIDFRSLLLAGIIIGTLGILDDITISQTAIVERLSIANSKYGVKELFSHAMSVGKDHIGSLVNTLILVYAGASLPLFLLFSAQNVSLGSTINHELIATEIVRTLVGSIGVVAAVPITTIIASFIYKNR